MGNLGQSKIDTTIIRVDFSQRVFRSWKLESLAKKESETYPIGRKTISHRHKTMTSITLNCDKFHR